MRFQALNVLILIATLSGCILYDGVDPSVEADAGMDLPDVGDARDTAPPDAAFDAAPPDAEVDAWAPPPPPPPPPPCFPGVTCPDAEPPPPPPCDPAGEWEITLTANSSSCSAAPDVITAWTVTPSDPGWAVYGPTGDRIGSGYELMDGTCLVEAFMSGSSSRDGRVCFSSTHIQFAATGAAWHTETCDDGTTTTTCMTEYTAIATIYPPQ